MTSTKFGVLEEDPPSLLAHTDTVGELTVTVIVEESTDPESFPSLIDGAATTSRMLGVRQLHIVAPAQHLPALAVAAAEKITELPADFLFCEAGCSEHDHSGGFGSTAMVLSAESMIQMDKVA